MQISRNLTKFTEIVQSKMVRERKKTCMQTIVRNTMFGLKREKRQLKGFNSSNWFLLLYEIYGIIHCTLQNVIVFLGILFPFYTIFHKIEYERVNNENVSNTTISLLNTWPWSHICSINNSNAAQRLVTLLHLNWHLHWSYLVIIMFSIDSNQSHSDGGKIVSLPF